MTRRSLFVAGVAALAAAGALVVGALLSGDDDELEPVTVADVREGVARLVVDGRPTLRLWVVTTPEARAAGVNGHPLTPGEGMWFGWDELATSAFWMRGVAYPLLIAWVGPDQRVIRIDRMEPCAEPGAECPLYEPPSPFRWAIELLPEDRDASGLRPGARVGMRP